MKDKMLAWFKNMFIYIFFTYIIKLLFNSIQKRRKLRLEKRLKKRLKRK